MSIAIFGAGAFWHRVGRCSLGGKGRRGALVVKGMAQGMGKSPREPRRLRRCSAAATGLIRHARRIWPRGRKAQEPLPGGRMRCKKAACGFLTRGTPPPLGVAKIIVRLPARGIELRTPDLRPGRRRSARCCDIGTAADPPPGSQLCDEYRTGVTHGPLRDACCRITQRYLSRSTTEGYNGKPAPLFGTLTLMGANHGRGASNERRGDRHRVPQSGPVAGRQSARAAVEDPRLAEDAAASALSPFCAIPCAGRGFIRL